MYKDMEKKLSVWDQLRDDIKAEYEKEAKEYPTFTSITELKATDYYTNIRYYIFNDIQFKAVVKLDYKVEDSRHFGNFLKPEYV